MIRIELEGKADRSFIFPSAIEIAYTYYSDMDRLLGWLTHISKVMEFGKGQYRLLYSTIELGIYSVNIYCDMQSVFDLENNTLKIVPITGHSTIQSKVTYHSLTAQGYFSSTSIFQPLDGKTQIDYSLQLRARLPVPFAARMLIPASVIDKVVSSIVYRRIQEIADTFIERSIRSYQA